MIMIFMGIAGVCYSAGHCLWPGVWHLGSDGRGCMVTAAYSKSVLIFLV